MPTFTPPRIPGPAPIGGRSHPLWRHYGNYDCGTTVWKDAQGNWHNSMVPYQGGFNHRNYNGDTFTSTSDTSVDSLANATEVYMGGSTYNITESKADELRAAGFFVGGHWTSEENKWTNYVLASPVNRGFKGGDASSSIQLVADGRTLYSHADTFIGDVDANGFVIGGGVVKNSLIIRNADGTLDPNQIYAAGGASPAWQHPNHPGIGFTPMDMIYDGIGTAVDNILVVGWAEPTVYGASKGEGLIMRMTVFLSPSSFTDYPLVDNPYEILPSQGKFNVTSVYNDSIAGFHYIVGRDQDLSRVLSYPFLTFPQGNQTQYVRMARVPLGQLDIPANWQYWTGSAWVTGQEPTVLYEGSKIRDINNNALDGLVDITRVGNDYILALITARSPAVYCYKSTSITGPYRLYHTADNPDRVPDSGFSPPRGTQFWSGFPKFQEHLNPNAQTLLISHSHGTFKLNGANYSDPNHASQFTPNFVYLPTPAAVGK